MPLLPLQTVVDFQLLYAARQAPCPMSPSSASTASLQQLWPIAITSSATDEDVLVDRPEASIFHYDLATSFHLGDPDVAKSSGNSGRPVSMFEVRSDGRSFSTATMSTGDANKDERAPVGPSDEARTAMMDVAGYIPSTSISDPPSSTGNRARLLPSSSPGVPLAKVADELQTARQLASKAMAIVESGETTSTGSEGNGDARIPTSLQAGMALYPGLSGWPDKTLLDYYSARAAKRKPDQSPRREYSPPRVTMSFFPSRSTVPADTPSSTATGHEPPAAERSSNQQPQQPPPRRMQSAADGLPASSTDTGHGRLPDAPATSEQNVPAASTTKSDSTPTSTRPAVTTEAAAAPTTEKTVPNSSRQVLKPVDRKSSEPLRVANKTHLRDGGETATGSGGRRTQNTSNGAATDVFLSSILSHLIPVPQSAEKDWGHFTLVKPTSQSQANVDSKATRNNSSTVNNKKSENYRSL